MFTLVEWISETNVFAVQFEIPDESLAPSAMGIGQEHRRRVRSHTMSC